MSSRVVHLALKVADLERATRFYEDVFGFRQTGTGHARGHVSRHMTDGAFDLALMVYDSEDEPEAQLSGSGPCIHHFGIEVGDRDAIAAKIVAQGGEIISDPNEGALKFRAPDGVVAETTRPGRYRKADIAGASICGLTIATPDPAVARTFYQSVFGFSADGEVLTDGRFRICLLSSPLEGRSGGAPRDEVAPQALRVRGESMTGTTSKRSGRHHHWMISVNNVSAFAKAIEQNGGVVADDAGTPLYRTPDGSLLELVTR